MAALAVVPSAATQAVDPEHATMPAVSGYVRYVNDRYHFVIDVPNEHTKFERSTEGDGRIYKNEAGDAVLKVFGAELVHPFRISKSVGLIPLRPKTAHNTRYVPACTELACQTPFALLSLSEAR